MTEQYTHRYDQSVCTKKGMVEQPIKGVIFDLDDTLYNEKEYVKSGYKLLCYLDIREQNKTLALFYIW